MDWATILGFIGTGIALLVVGCFALLLWDEITRQINIQNSRSSPSITEEPKRVVAQKASAAPPWPTVLDHKPELPSLVNLPMEERVIDIAEWFFELRLWVETIGKLSPIELPPAPDFERVPFESPDRDYIRMAFNYEYDLDAYVRAIKQRIKNLAEQKEQPALPAPNNSTPVHTTVLGPGGGLAHVGPPLTIADVLGMVPKNPGRHQVDPRMSEVDQVLAMFEYVKSVTSYTTQCAAYKERVGHLQLLPNSDEALCKCPHNPGAYQDDRNMSVSDQVWALFEYVNSISEYTARCDVYMEQVARLRLSSDPVDSSDSMEALALPFPDTDSI